MHGPWHVPEHPDEADNSAWERACERADFEALAEAHLRPADEDAALNTPEASDGLK